VSRIPWAMVLVVAAQAQTFTSLVSFDGANGSRPGLGALVQGLDGRFYGTTLYGGAAGSGTFFAFNLPGNLTSLYSFAPAVGASPNALMLAANGTFYGTAEFGGQYNDGTIFSITPGGALTMLYTFNAYDHAGYTPVGGLVEGFDGILYGTTQQGGYGTGYGQAVGTPFAITPGGVFKSLGDFNGDDGAFPGSAMVQGRNGLLYGVSVGDGVLASGNNGTIYSLSQAGVLSLLVSFDQTDGAYPWGGLVQGTDGNLYGTTSQGGSVGGLGTVFRVTTGGTLTTLYAFKGSDGAQPWGALIQGTDGNFYGTTIAGGANDEGTIFQITRGGALTTLHSFDGTDGYLPWGGLVQGTDGNFYGTTYEGGANNDGTLFELSMGLAPFVRTVPWFGKTGATVTVLGTNLTGATGVSFNGAAAEFTILSATAITATVPAGATSGKVGVTTPSGTTASNVAFQVLE
jgi:uncharacterized repeat protein (TIGR03803 family)